MLVKCGAMDGRKVREHTLRGWISRHYQWARVRDNRLNRRGGWIIWQKSARPSSSLGSPFLYRSARFGELIVEKFGISDSASTATVHTTSIIVERVWVIICSFVQGRNWFVLVGIVVLLGVRMILDVCGWVAGHASMEARVRVG
jgi:hypothetical protein